jgi:hypothetical protein
MQNILSCRPLSYGKYRDKAYEHLAKMGIRYVEILMPRLEDAEGTLEVLGTFGLSVTSLRAPLISIAKKFLKRAGCLWKLQRY